MQTPWHSVSPGLFSTWSPNRPNPLDFSVVKFIERTGNILIVSDIDALEGTPVIDLKTYIPFLIVKNSVKSDGSAAELKTGNFNSRMDFK